MRFVSFGCVEVTGAAHAHYAVLLFVNQMAVWLLKGGSLFFLIIKELGGSYSFPGKGNIDLKILEVPRNYKNEK